MRAVSRPQVVSCSFVAVALAMSVMNCTTTEDNGPSGVGGKTSSSGGAGGRGGTSASTPPGTGGKKTGGTTAGGGAGGTGGVNSAGGTTGGGGGTGQADAAVTPDATPPAPVDTAPEAGAPSNLRWPKCVPIFDGKTFDGWGGTDQFEIKPGGVMASKGPGAQNYTVKDYKEFRWIMSLRQVSGNHNPSIIMWGHNRNRGLAGIQVQAPTCGGWDYRDGHNNALPVTCPGNAGTSINKWSQCEFLAKANGKLRMACCQQDDAGLKPCKGVENMVFNDPAAPSLGAVGIMIHNDGIKDEFKDICMEENPTEDELITTKYTPTP